MAGACSCDVSFNNTGVPNCVPAYLVWKKFIVVPLVANDGTDNKILSSDTLNSAFFTALINHADASKRWYPLPNMKNIESTKAENITETFNDQSVIFVAEGVRGINALLVGHGATLAGQLKAARCSQFGVYPIDGNGSLYGYTNNETGALYPIPIDNNTWAPVWQMASDTTVQKIQLTFQFDANLQDEYIAQIVNSDITGINLLSTSGLVDILSTDVSGSVTTIVIDMYNRYGSNFNKLPMEGLVITDFYDVAGGAASKVYDTTSSTALALTSVTESTTIPGRYTLVMTVSQTIGDVIRITPVKTGYDFTAVIANTVTLA
ncbi:MAG: hypothetical protein V4538_15580 [Bacteroidota bacterium]